MKKIAVFTLLICNLACSASSEKESFNTKYTDQELGQLLVIGFKGTEINTESPIVQNLKKYNIGGVILTDIDDATGATGRNIVDANQLLKLSSALVAYSQNPPIIAIDQEGGNVSRLKQEYGFPPTKSAEYLGRIDNPDSTLYYARSIAQEFMVVGVNTNFAPVVDVNLNPDNPDIGALERSFSSNPNKVVEHAGYVLDEFDKEGILSVIKHFPGQGSATNATYKGIPDITNTWQRNELQPFKELIENRTIHAVMAGHLYNANIDSMWPATLSENTIQDLLRDSIGFKGVVFSEDMQEEAILESYGLETAIEQALNAGVDILLFRNLVEYDEDIAEKAITIMQKGIAEGRINETRVDSALARVGRLKKEVIEDLCTCLTF
ncbi:MAG: glycoside hydrolase family 3 protein [Balneolaceae bacterium]|nr:glycoside hydrolase family 3 protein [Balneolaceae bacterium]